MKWLAVLLLAPMLMLSVALVPVVGLAVLASQVAPAVSGVGIEKVVGFLEAQVGKPYSKSEPDGPDSWDCSGLVSGAYATVGVTLPSLTFDQVKLGEAVDVAAVQPGDALFMRGGSPVTDLGHVGVAVSASDMISAPAPGQVVHRSPIPWASVQQVRRYLTATTPAYAGSWEEFYTARYETSGIVDPAAVLTPVQAAVLFWRAGCRGSNLIDIVAIATRESGLNWTAYNFHAATTGDISLSLTQINIKDGMIARLADYGLTDPRELLNPFNAARATFVLSKGCTDLRPWGGYKGQSNTYGTDMPAAVAAVTAAYSQGLIGA